jgi:hypothetical protein
VVFAAEAKGLGSPLAAKGLTKAMTLIEIKPHRNGWKVFEHLKKS